METKLLPCPFCGSIATMARFDWMFWVICDNPECLASVPGQDFTSEADAITAWNTRALSERHQRLVEAAREFLRVICSNTIQNNKSLKAINALKAALEGEG